MLSLSHRQAPRLAALSLSVLLLLGCQEGENNATSNEDSDHHHSMITSRLLISEHNSQTLHLFDSQAWRQRTQFTLQQTPSGLKTSPKGRYALALQRNFDQVEVIDSGIVAEQHGDHYHLHNHSPRLLSERYQGVKPTHYDVTQDQVALFFDGDNTTSANAQFRVLDEQSIGQVSSVAIHSFDHAQHGTAQLLRDFAFTGIKDQSTTSLPDKVIALKRHGDHFHRVQSFTAQDCPALHGSAQTANLVAFACLEHVLVVNVQGETITSQSINNPTFNNGTRFGTLFGYPANDTLLAVANNQQFFSLKNGHFQEIDWKTEQTQRTLAYLTTEEYLFIVTPQARLIAYHAADYFAQQFSLSLWDNVPTLAEGQRIQMAFDPRNQQLFITNPADQTVLQLSVTEPRIVQRHQLGFIPQFITWLGTTEHEHHH